MSDDQPDPPLLSRRALLGAVSAAPLVCTSAVASQPPTDGLIARCAQWLAADFESDHLARRWASLETAAVAGYDYFRMGEGEHLALPMGPEMAAIEGKLDDLFKVRRRHFRAIARMTPTSVHEMACLLVIAARIESHDPGPAAPMVRRAMEYVVNATCPGCGAPYVPTSLPTA